MTIPDRRNGFYYINDNKYVSVTTALEILAKPALVVWAAKQAAIIALDDPTLSDKEVVGKVFEKRDKAGERGKTIHSLAEEYAKGADIDIETVPDKYKPYAKGLKSCLEAINPEILLTEQKVWSDKYNYAGTLDGIWRINGEIWLIDYKTAKAVYDGTKLQMVAYKEAALEMKLIDRVDKMKTILLKDNGTYDIVETEGDFNAFRAVLYLWRWVNA